MELSDWHHLLKILGFVVTGVGLLIGISAYLVGQKAKTNDRLENELKEKKIQEDIIKNNYEENKLNDLRNELTSYLSENDIESPFKITNINKPPTDKQVEVVLNFLKNELVNAKPATNKIGHESNSINAIAGSIAKLFDSSNSKGDFEEAIKEIAKDTIASKENAKKRILHGVIIYFDYDFENKIELMIELSEGTKGLKYENGKSSSPSISFEYFTQLMMKLRNIGNETYLSYLNDKEFVNKLNDKGILDEFNLHFPEVNGKRSNQYFNNIEKTYLFQFLN